MNYTAEKLAESPHDRFIIFSVFHFLEDSDTNADNTNTVEAFLQLQGIPYRKIYGKYKNNFEYSFIVSEDYLQQIREIAFDYHQETILLLGKDKDGTRKATLMYILNNMLQPMGDVVEATREDAMEADSYYYDYELNKYFINQ